MTWSVCVGKRWYWPHSLVEGIVTSRRHWKVVSRRMMWLFELPSGARIMVELGSKSRSREDTTLQHQSRKDDEDLHWRRSSGGEGSGQIGGRASRTGWRIGCRKSIRSLGCLVLANQLDGCVSGYSPITNALSIVLFVLPLPRGAHCFQKNQPGSL